MQRKRIKICLACSAGGHFEQLRLAKQTIPSDKYDFYWVTCKYKHLKNVLKDERCYTITNATLKK